MRKGANGNYWCGFFGHVFCLSGFLCVLFEYPPHIPTPRETDDRFLVSRIGTGDRGIGPFLGGCQHELDKGCCMDVHRLWLYGVFAQRWRSRQARRCSGAKPLTPLAETVIV